MSKVSHRLQPQRKESLRLLSSILTRVSLWGKDFWTQPTDRTVPNEAAFASVVKSKDGNDEFLDFVWDLSI
jgi:hypothetical protein